MSVLRKQYRYLPYASFQYAIILYENGAQKKWYKVWEDELKEELERLETDGYRPGFTREEVLAQKDKYQYMFRNVIDEKEGE